LLTLNLLLAFNIEKIKNNPGKESQGANNSDNQRPQPSYGTIPIKIKPAENQNQCPVLQKNLPAKSAFLSHFTPPKICR
jgi:hypothetical protein